MILEGWGGTFRVNFSPICPLCRCHEFTRGTIDSHVSHSPIGATMCLGCGATIVFDLDGKNVYGTIRPTIEQETNCTTLPSC